MFIHRQQGLEKLKKEGGEGYLASSADLMIGILFIFIIMVVYLAIEIKRIQTSDGRSKDPVRTLVEEIGQRLKAKGIGVQLDPDSGVISLPADALFNKGAHVPREDALGTIKSTSDVLGEVIPCYVTAAKRKGQSCQQLNKKGVELETVMVEGHTDSDQYANDPDKNWHLGLDRARFIFNELERGDLGVLKNRKGQPILGVSSYADTRPTKSLKADSASNVEYDLKAKDRRVELRFILSYQDNGADGSAAEITRAIEQRK
jgi:flagellar motor protein MotB